MKVLSVIFIICASLLTDSLSAQLDINLHYDQHFSFRSGKVVGLIIDAPLNRFSIGTGIQYAFLDDYAFLSTVGTMPDGTIGKGNGIGFHVNLKLFSDASRTGFFGELSYNLQFINPTDNIDNGIFSDQRDQNYSVMQPSISVGYLVTSKSGFMSSLSFGYGIESFKAFNDRTQIDGVFKMSFKVGRRI